MQRAAHNKRPQMHKTAFSRPLPALPIIIIFNTQTLNMMTIEILTTAAMAEMKSGQIYAKDTKKIDFWGVGPRSTIDQMPSPVDDRQMFSLGNSSQECKVSQLQGSRCQFRTLWLKLLLATMTNMGATVLTSRSCLAWVSEKNSIL